MAVQKEIWTRNDKETDEAWEAFEIFRESDPPLNLAEVAKRLDKSYGLIREWSSRHHWRKRRNAHQAHLDSLFLRDLDKHKVRVRRKQLQIGEQGAQLLGYALKGYLKQAKAGEVVELRAADLSKLLGFLKETVNSMELPDSITRIEDDRYDFSKLEPDELVAFRAILKKAERGE